ncbi:NUDIX hydrolase [Allonocardiopsis opalescens]|uniref:NUDIX domain-containing protein n=1 Tax=Allonocardiopsis opalescens TaxID=1144618 RepID=A0A2T0PSY5_9ACTN|nr:NUDIX hydrolase [Allonocardiopsis opalescens]PRX92007.1 NUDIX domain-containing protein [Allonocardiopsis opalescens]
MPKDPWRCDQHSVGILITRPGDDGPEYVVITRDGDGPSGVAPVAGHVFDEFDGPEEALTFEVSEEVGQTVSDYRLVAEGWRPNRCGPSQYLPDGHSGEAGHYWWIYEATVFEGYPLRPQKGETRDARWVTAATLQTLAERTAAYTRSDVSEDEWQRNPGLEPVWCHWLTHLGTITLPKADLKRIAQRAAAVPVPA